MFYKIIALTALLTVLPVSANNNATAIDIQSIKSQAAISLEAQLNSELLQLNKEVQSLTLDIELPQVNVPTTRYVNNIETASTEIIGD
jgi:uncharacterized membrane protein YjgN (DUF898 family)